jgi:hypothetical protein
VHQVLLELDEEALPPEDVGVAAGGGLCFLAAPLGHQRRHLAPPAAGERDEALSASGERLRLDAGLAPLMIEVGVGEEAAEVGIAPLRLAEESEVVACRVCTAD